MPIVCGHLAAYSFGRGSTLEKTSARRQEKLIMEIKDIAGVGEIVKRVIDSLDKGVSSLLSPFAYKRMEKAKMR